MTWRLSRSMRVAAQLVVLACAISTLTTSRTSLIKPEARTNSAAENKAAGDGPVLREDSAATSKLPPSPALDTVSDDASAAATGSPPAPSATDPFAPSRSPLLGNLASTIQAASGQPSADYPVGPTAQHPSPSEEQIPNRNASADWPSGPMLADAPSTGSDNELNLTMPEALSLLVAFGGALALLIRHRRVRA